MDCQAWTRCRAQYAIAATLCVVRLGKFSCLMATNASMSAPTSMPCRTPAPSAISAAKVEQRNAHLVQLGVGMETDGRAHV